MAPIVSSNEVLRQYMVDALTREVAAGQLKSSVSSSSELDGICRDMVLDLCESLTPEDSVATLTRLLELVLDCAEAGTSGADLPLGLMEEALDVLTISKCDQLFSFLETHRHRMTARMGKGQTLLRLCNELLRRLSKTKDTVFCGRILIFLSLVFPLSERSAVNLRGEYNLDNATIFESEPEEPSQLRAIDADAEMASAESSNNNQALGGIAPESIYTTFWSLQAYFNNPAHIISAPLILARFRSALDTVLQAFEAIENVQVRLHGDTVSISPLDTETIRGYFTPKMLTSKKLLALELADLTFRRHVLIQALIVLQYLTGLSAQSKDNWNAKVLTTNKSLITPYVLPTSDAEWASETTTQIMSIMGANKQGPEFVKIVETLLDRDQAWLGWKCNGCPPYDIDPLDSARIAQAPSKVEMLTAPKRPYSHKVGNAVLSRLWASAGGWSDKELEEGLTLPSPDSFTQPIQAIEAELQDALQDDEIASLEDRKASQAWRALRIARLTDIEHFTNEVAGARLDKYLVARSQDVSNGLNTADLVAEAGTKAEAASRSVPSMKRSASETVSEVGEEKRQKLMEDHMIAGTPSSLTQNVEDVKIEHAT
ncbi:Putative uncharacterized protein [Taphrina deformans PYCC 5710]|uniref:THO complex subunit 1 n=1 Tax=Taphrina deformans (strain PYCC 5710 / ATCC 11124 / CBS 356.35 / IMI 108563 / JCM 9778 / NBRC 8474) TaxID=1097556 RepID=R4XAS9_TAPDE|nr:Putative uncharacterized protein [Taphrina deformans PYCC 5710]|eukprot:CCG82964.1 Putative uncharacterized protein [Taphrina deformans PYCC 5710]